MVMRYQVIYLVICMWLDVSHGNFDIIIVRLRISETRKKVLPIASPLQRVNVVHLDSDLDKSFRNPNEVEKSNSSSRVAAALNRDAL